MADTYEWQLLEDIGYSYTDDLPALVYRGNDEIPCEICQRASCPPHRNPHSFMDVARHDRMRYHMVDLFYSGILVRYFGIQQVVVCRICHHYLKYPSSILSPLFPKE